MLKNPTDRQDQSRTGSTSGRGRGNSFSVPFLKVEDFSAGDVKTAKILGVDPNAKGFNDIIVKIAMNGKSFFFGMKSDNPNYEILFKGLGPDENKWVGQEISIGLEWNDFYDKNFVRVFCTTVEVPAPASQAQPKKRA